MLLQLLVTFFPFVTPTPSLCFLIFYLALIPFPLCSLFHILLAIAFALALAVALVGGVPIVLVGHIHHYLAIALVLAVMLPVPFGLSSCQLYFKEKDCSCLFVGYWK